MWRSRGWVGCIVRTAALTLIGMPLVGLIERPSTQAPEHIEVMESQELVTGVLGSADLRVRRSSAWLDLHGGRSRAVNREQDLWRYEF